MWLMRLLSLVMMFSILQMDYSIVESEEQEEEETEELAA